MTGPVLSVDGVRAGYGRIEVLHGLTFDVPASSVVALLGPNGVGKTTALRTISGQVPAGAGTITFRGERIEAASVTDIAAAGLLLVPEGRGLFPGLTVEENLRLARASLAPDQAGDEYLGEVMDLFPVLGSRLSQQAGSLSGGEQQMLAIARVLVDSARLVMFDELSMGLAPTVVDRLFEAVRAMRDRGVTVVLVEQFFTRVSDLADICYVLSKGRVIWAGEPGELAGSDVSALATAPQT